MPHKLPLTLKVRRVTRTPQAIEIESHVEDADGVSVQAVPLSVGGHRTVAEVCQILQSHVEQVAKSLHRRGLATTQAAPAVPETDDDFNALTTRQFTGSVST